MNILFMIGNGFDVNVGLKTKFEDFMPHYVEKTVNDKIIREFKDVIVKEGYETWSDFEKQLGLYAKDFDASTKANFIHCRDDFVDGLIEYLREQEARVDLKNKNADVVTAFVDSLTNFYRNNRLRSGSARDIATTFDVSRNERHFYRFMTFNYTQVFDTCINVLRRQHPLPLHHDGSNTPDSIAIPLHIHGTLDEDMLIGVDNTSQIANDKLSNDNSFSDNLIKSQMNGWLRNGNHARGMELIESSHIICVFGMSLGETDLMWWEKLGKWLFDNNDRHLVLWEYDPNYTRSNPRDFRRFDGRVIRRFFDRSNLSTTEQDDVENRIHVGFNCGGENDLFNIKLAEPEKIEFGAV
ncbi:MAG: bacteriophage abortive infection AbiH family protein [Defluviitaleaceae bacterium]|nr:bacteriophage abortive infection AbiH family protein [Defluviitaleaceae bacterium]MCL2263806.1 bacteriophage abortive infection AbiH family protein [Defluviitaleaceae bacterium]